jgi:hypothetical protein
MPVTPISWFPAGTAAPSATYESLIDRNRSVVLYANKPYPTATGCVTGQAPNGDPTADSEISTLSHGLNESITDPTG